ncbi:hypothetical protein lbkm_0350 [Lachnospiraceae bacterium KM106-2]|nr:hypothetical protein lbkm_0350 [Lachnospiraceae bacterium KM106-2]
MKKIEEFWYCVACQEDLPLYKGHELDSKISDNLITCIHFYRKRKISGAPIELILSNLLLEYPSMISDIRLLLGISDKRLYLDLTYLNSRAKLGNGRALGDGREYVIKHDTKFFTGKLKTDVNREAYASLIAGYFIDKGIEVILNTFASLDDAVIKQLFNNLIAPKEIQQKQAKYRGHGAEMTFANVFADCNMKFIPDDKHIDPMASMDPNVDLETMELVGREVKKQSVHSFDLVVLDEDKNVRILVQSLIHSSDPGQYGVNKSDETVLIKQAITDYNQDHPDKPVYLLGSVDGVGFCENPNGTIVKMLDAFDDFFQMHTLFKIPLFLQRTGFIDNINGVHLHDNFFETYARDHMNKAYIIPSHARLLDEEELTQTKHKTIGQAEVGFE